MLHTLFKASAHPIPVSFFLQGKSYLTRHRHLATKPKTIGILREEQSVWERRAPLSPSHCHRLIQQGTKVLIQPSARRTYPDHLYEQAGAHIQTNLDEADLLLGVKTPSINSLLPKKTYCFFSHTTKGQSSNMPLLKEILRKNIRLLDYEKMTDENGKRLVAFGKYAGVSGMVNILHGLGLRLLALGYSTPFIHIGPPHTYPSITRAMEAVREVGMEIAAGSTPKSLGPLTFVFTGSGNVSQGAQSIFRLLPHEYVTPQQLPLVAAKGEMNKLYACQVSRKHYLLKPIPKDCGCGPPIPISTFAETIAPHTRVLVNGIYWGLHAPKLLTTKDLSNLVRRDKRSSLPNLLAVCDISADPGGSLEFVDECTSIDNPFRVYDAQKKKKATSLKGEGVLYCSIDNMPTQFPLEATDSFGQLLLPFMPHILSLSQQPKFEPEMWSKPISGAVVATNGQLTEQFQYIHPFMEKHERTRMVQAETGKPQRKVMQQ